MKKFRLMLWMQLLMLPLIVFFSFSGCSNVGNDSTTTTLPSEKDSIATNPSVESKFIIYENLGSDDWTYLLVADTDNLMLVEDSLGNFVRAYGLFEGNEVRMNFDERKELFTLRIDSMYEMELRYKGDSVFVYNNNSFHSFSISELCENVTRVSNGDVLGALFSEAIGELIPSVISAPIELMKYLYETDDMNHHEKIDYIENGDYGLVPPELLDKLFGWADKKEPGESCPNENHVHAVDLGLSVKWACCNVGANVPEGYGGYYAWGETEEKSDYTEYTYKYVRDLDGDGNYWDDEDNWMNIGSNISGTQYDVAHVKWGGSWRMPTLDEIKELVNKCSWKWTSLNGVSGQLVTGPNGNSIFLPAAGSRRGAGLYSRGSYGYYWSATLHEYYSGDACSLYFYDGYYYWRYWDYRRYGLTVRPVTE